MSDAVLIAIVTGPAVLAIDRMISWLRNRSKDEAEAGLTVDQRWENLADRLDRRVAELEDRVTDLEKEIEREREQKRALAAEVDRYKRIAKSLLRYVIKLRDGLAEATGTPPSIPSDIEEAITTLDLP